MMMPIIISNKLVGQGCPIFIIAEIGINHEGSMEKAKLMVDAAARAGASAAKFQMHVIEDEMIPEAKKVIPGNAKESIWDIMKRCALTQEQHLELKKYVEQKGLIYLCTPFSRVAADLVEQSGVAAYKIGSGECNNYPLIEHIASFGKPIILSTGMNNISSIAKSVEIFRRYKVPFILFHCTSMYPTPYECVRLGGMIELQKAFNCQVGLSDHSVGIYTCLGAVALGATIVEKHFTVDKTWPGPDVPISIDEQELKELVKGCDAIRLASGGKKEILKEEQLTIDFAYASVVSIKEIKAGEIFTKDNIWVKRPGTGEIMAVDFDKILGKRAKHDISQDVFIQKADISI